METLILEKKDEVYLTVDADPSIQRELSEFFTFYVPGYKFMPAFRNRMWDGKIRLFSPAGWKWADCVLKRSGCLKRCLVPLEQAAASCDDASCCRCSELARGDAECMTERNEESFP